MIWLFKVANGKQKETQLINECLSNTNLQLLWMQKKNTELLKHSSVLKTGYDVHSKFI